MRCLVAKCFQESDGIPRVRKVHKLIHQSYRSLLTRLGKGPRVISSHPKAEIVCILRPEKPRISFKSCFQQSIGLPSSELVIGHPEVKLYRLKDCWLAGGGALIYPEKDYLLALDEATRPCPLIKASRAIPVLAAKLNKPVFHLAANCDSRAHHVMQHLSRYQLAGERLPPATAILIHQGQTHWQSAYLQLANAAAPLVETSEGTLFCREMYYVPIAGGPGTNLTGEPEHYLMLRKKALHKRWLERRPVFISRRDAPDRRLVNEDQIFDIAKSRIPNLARISLTGLSFEEQIAQVAGAPFCIGPHGQGTHLTLFCEQTISIQLVPGLPTIDNKFYKCALLFDYFASLGGQNKTVTLASGVPLTTDTSDWDYPEERFKKELAAVLRKE